MAALERAAAAPPEEQGQRQQGGIGQVISMVARAGLMYAFMMWMRSGTSGGESSTPLVGVDPVGMRRSCLRLDFSASSDIAMFTFAGAVIDLSLRF